MRDRLPLVTADQWLVTGFMALTFLFVWNKSAAWLVTRGGTPEMVGRGMASISN